ncbi:hypothetical protein BU23DRAFT_578813 [Bimuria novae-zelandiae CBS 107.79]|uniref:Uncharacterized protein n=1 Tax=Bimuria novae-zelandiae CBS 107.79 TaxID=1447943 RepID=A0A6A5VFQ6_9PLEO|nr:hypothetical protein BU23DRAFT_578813 [Bimuria novae-zelandiae CBS 107.79]
MPGLKKSNEVNLVGDLMSITILSPVEDSTRRVTEVRASTDVCLKSPYLKMIIDDAKDRNNITLVCTEAAIVWLAHLHGLSSQHMRELGLHDVSVVAVWEVIQMWVLDKKRNNIKAFDHAVGFARVTKYFVYNNIGFIKERKPKGIRIKTLHLTPNEFTGPVNHARGGLKTTLHKHIWKKAGNVLRFNTEKCDCWDATIGQYLAALVKIDAFPIENAVTRSSFQAIIDRMKEFKYDYTPACPRCRSIDFAYVVQLTHQAALSYFDGLCLDCMDRSKPKSKDLDDEYWRINANVDHRWDSRCRTRHGQPSWYVSWLGREDVKQKLLGRDRGYVADGDDGEED